MFPTARAVGNATMIAEPRSGVRGSYAATRLSSEIPAFPRLAPWATFWRRSAAKTQAFPLPWLRLAALCLCVAVGSFLAGVIS